MKSRAMANIIATKAIWGEEEKTMGMGPIKITPPNSKLLTWEIVSKAKPRNIIAIPKKTLMGFIKIKA